MAAEAKTSTVFMNNEGSIRISEESALSIFCFKNEMEDGQRKYRIQIADSREWEKNDLFLSEIPRGNERFEKQNNKFKDEGNSQISLLMAEIYFICSCVKKTNNVLIVYIGGHPGDHINFLGAIFKDFEFHVYDYHGETQNEVCMSKIDTVENKNIMLFHEYFTADTAMKYKNSKKEIYLISDIRNIQYQAKGITAEMSSKIIDEDMYSQILWCQIIKPVFSLLKYRPKLPSECLTAHPILTHSDDEKTVEKSKNLYYKYPRGQFLKIPHQKKTQKAMYFITNIYDLTEKYYHHDMISAMEYHHNYIRRCLVFDNPFESDYLTNTAIFGLDDVIKVAKEKKFGISEDKCHEYCLSCDWDDRAVVYIIMCLVLYLGLETNLRNDKFGGIRDDYKKYLGEYYVYPYLFMKYNQCKKEEN